MENLKKAEELYLRGFCSEYIKRRTGVSVQRLLKILLAQGVRYTLNDITQYQIDYIRQRYTLDDVMMAYRDMSLRYPVLEKAAKGKHIECLGCGFGKYSVVFSELLGKDVYKKLKNECWTKKQRGVMQDKYGVSNAFEKGSGFLEVSPMTLDFVKAKRANTMIKKYGFPHPNQNPDIKKQMLENMRNTNVSRYGVENAMQCSEIAEISAEHRQASMLKKYGAPNSVQIEEIRNRIFEKRRVNGTLSSSMGEDVLYEMLVEYFGEDDVLRNVCVDFRYPYHVDFYVKSRDLFIELNGDQCHYRHWFDANNEQDMQVLRSWEENRDRLESDMGRESRYRKYIDTWTGSDVAKRSAAREYELNYIVFWDGSRRIMRNKKQFPRLKDANEWFEAGCPDSKNWRKENTY